MKPMILLGDDAVGQAAMDAGITTAYGYPGTPSTEILEYIERAARKRPDLKCAWAANEKVAYEQGVGTSFTGRRTLVTMKHVGLNVAADPFVNSAITGASGGLVLAVADDPGMHSSQNEQDSRFFADFAMIHCFEPATQQEAYDMTREAFDVSERFGAPVMLRLVTRLAHSRADVVVRPPREQNPLAPGTDRARWTLVPSTARPQYEKLVRKQPQLRAYAEESPWNDLFLSPERRDIGVVTAGVAYNYLREVAGESPPSFLKVGLYPVPMGKLRRLLEHVETVLFLEDGYPFLEQRVLGLLGQDPARFRGRFTGHVPACGELSPDLAARALGLPVAAPPEPPAEVMRARPPQLCQGCPHRESYKALNVIRERQATARVFADIGCYTLGYYPPFETITSCLDMGASIGMAKGASDAGLHPALCVIGDSTFGHSGMTPLLTAAHENTNMTVLILDNSTVAMTGTQESISTGDRLSRLVEGLGVPREHIRHIVPLPKNLDENVRVIQEEIDHPGLSVIIAQRACLEIK